MSPESLFGVVLLFLKLCWLSVYGFIVLVFVDLQGAVRFLQANLADALNKNALAAKAIESLQQLCKDKNEAVGKLKKEKENLEARSVLLEKESKCLREALAAERARSQVLSGEKAALQQQLDQSVQLPTVRGVLILLSSLFFSSLVL